MNSSQEHVTELLLRWGGGDRKALDELLPLVYDELRRLARRYLRRERPGHTLQPTALVNEAYLKLIDQREISWQNRAHFFGVAARLMREILVDHARSHMAAKRGGGEQRMTLDEGVASPAAIKPNIDLLRLDDALQVLAKLDPQQCRIVELRYFGGLTIEETAEVLVLSPATIKREWQLARAWLYHEISES